MKTLRPKKYKEEEFFIADEVEISSFRDELASMEHPFFALKGGDDKVREYRNNNISVLVRPATGIGLATVFDKDIWIYAISKLQQAIFEGKPISRTIAFTPYEFFVTTNRDKGGRSYDELKKALERLAGTRIQTNIVYSSEKQEKENFGLIDKWRILEEKKGRLDIGMVEVTLPDWLYQGITKNKVLKINSDYFRIRKAIDRRIYEIARKHCGYQKSFSLSIELLHLKSGATSNKREFKRSIKKLSLVNDLPDYEVLLDAENDCVTFTNRHFDESLEKKMNQLAKNKNMIEEVVSNGKLPKKLQKKVATIADKISKEKR